MFFLAGSGYGEGTLFPWVISDFSLTDAIESGSVKVPRVPVADNTLNAKPVYHNLWTHIGKVFRGVKKTQVEPILPKKLQGTLDTLYSNYQSIHNGKRRKP